MFGVAPVTRELVLWGFAFIAFLVVGAIYHAHAAHKRTIKSLAEMFSASRFETSRQQRVEAERLSNTPPDTTPQP